MEDTWTIKAALDWTEGYLLRKGDDNPRLSAQWLMSEATGLSRVQLYTNFDKPLTSEERGIFREFVLRRGKGEPLQYITGEVGFRYITLKVREGVLIPRPETEVLVSEALAQLPPSKKTQGRWSDESHRLEAAAIEAAKEQLADVVADMRFQLGDDSMAEASCSSEPGQTSEAADTVLVADLCTGSGCIACSIAFERADARVIATDVAPEAVSLARQNVDELQLDDRIRVLQGDLGACIPEKFLGRFDVVVSNPPYIPTAVLDDLSAEVTAFEPKLALDGGEDGNDLFRRILPWALTALKPGGSLAVELHETCLDQAAQLASLAGYCGVRIVEDLAGRPRVLVAMKPLA